MRRRVLLVAVAVVVGWASGQGSQPYIGQIVQVAFNFAPTGWAQCNGQLLPIGDNEALFNLIGTTYGGDGQDTFALPDLRGRIALHQGQGPGLSSRTIGQSGGVETVTLTSQQVPAHTHAFVVSTKQGDLKAPASSAVLGASTFSAAYAPAGSATGQQIAGTLAGGGGQPHTNMPPYLATYYIISLYGVYPSQT
ncbi:Phage tail collar domain-containing protein [Plasmodiophora brassicae]|uniref:Phage tail collar domain-containing protein n=1 Tax=Plasmodiophora brassicae TaxID=37360 RepID=A0A0G4IPJ5_PLABS|nr:hypothetical protein PBRA_005693 [Plasmodiophora brassicae]SPR01065.1 unnamed protein product [Plasmodiophora brassicae]